jgi:hypothetical protein
VKLGKGFEQEVLKELKKLKSRYKNFDYLRLQDSHAAQGHYIRAQPADFLIFYYSKVFNKSITEALELKECKNTSLPISNITQLPKLLRLFKAGVLSYVVVKSEYGYHKYPIKMVNKIKKKRNSLPLANDTLTLGSIKDILPALD